VNLAVLLVSSKSNTFIERGVFNLTELLRDSTKLEREIGFCALYHLALGHYKQGDPRTALGEVTRLLDAKSFHTSALALKQLCINRMIKNQKNSGIFSRLFSRKDDSGPTSVTPPPLPIMSPEEELQLRQEEEKRRRELASMFASTGEGEEIDEEELIRKIIAEDNQRHFDSASPRVLLDDASSSAGNYRGSYSSNASFSTSGQQRDSYLSDTFENGAIASPSVAPASVLVHHRDPSQRASMWVRSKRVTQDLTGFSDARHGKPHDSLPVSLLKKKTRPLRASQSARSSPSAEYLAKLTASSSPNQGKEEGTIEDEEEEEEGEEEVEDLPFEQPQFIFESYTPSPEIGILEAQLSGIGEVHARQDEELKTAHQANIAKCQVEYQALLQLHQTAQYELLRRQQEEVSELQNAQFALIEEEKRIRSMPPEEQGVEAMQLLQQKMLSLSQRQGPLLAQQQQAQVEIVTGQQAEQKAKQEAFKAVLLSHNQQIMDLRSNQANEVLGLQYRITQLKQDDLQRYEDRRSEAAAVYRAHIETLMAQHQAEKDARQAASDARRLERQKARDQRAEEARLRREEARQAEEAEVARQAALKAEQQRIEDTIRAQQEALYRQQQEEMFKQQEAIRVQEEAQLMLQQQQQQQQQQLQMLQQQQYEVQQLQLIEQQRKQELEAQQQAQARPQVEMESPVRLPQQAQQQVLPPNTLPKQPLGAGFVKFAKPPMPSKSPPPTSASPEVIDVFAIVKGPSKPSGPPSGGALPKVPTAAVGVSVAVPPSGKLALAAVSGALPPAPLSTVPPSVSKRPPSSQLPPTPTPSRCLPRGPQPLHLLPALLPPWHPVLLCPLSLHHQVCHHYHPVGPLLVELFPRHPQPRRRHLSWPIPLEAVHCRLQAAPSPPLLLLLPIYKLLPKNQRIIDQHLPCRPFRVDHLCQEFQPPLAVRPSPVLRPHLVQLPTLALVLQCLLCQVLHPPQRSLQRP
jgi:hypothetical protein